MNEQETLDTIFGNVRLWKNKYRILWCDLCQCASIGCPDCGGSSCNSMSCEKCDDDIVEFSTKCKVLLEDYLNDNEIRAIYKGRAIQKLILDSLGNGDTSIDFSKMRKQGKFSAYEETLFQKELIDTEPYSG